MTRPGLWLPVRLARPIILAILISTPTSAGAPGNAEILAEGEVEAIGALLLTAPLGVFSPDGEGWSGATLACASLRVTKFEAETVRVANVEVPSDKWVTSYSLTNTQAIVQDADRASWVGIYPSADLSLDGRAVGPLKILPEASPIIGNSPATPEPEPFPDQPSFGWQVEGDALTTNSTGLATINGTLTIKLSGSLIEISADENTSTLDTRDSAQSPVPGQDVRRWAYLECHGGVLDSAAPITLVSATRALRLVDAQRVSAFVEHATLDVGNSPARADGSPFYMQGNFSGDVAALRQGSTLLTRLGLQGEIEATSIQVPASRSAAPWVGALLIGLALGATGSGLLLFRRRRQEINVDQCLDMAGQYGETGHYAAAVEWIDLALKQAPGHTRLLTDKGHFLAEMGNVAEALTAFRAAAPTSNGEAELLLALLVCRVGGDMEEAAQALCSGMEKSPILALDVEDDPDFAALRERPDVRLALRRAQTSLGD